MNTEEQVAKQVAEMNEMIRAANNEIANLAGLYLSGYPLNELTQMFVANMKIIKTITYSKRVLEETQN